MSGWIYEERIGSHMCTCTTLIAKLHWQKWASNAHTWGLIYQPSVHNFVCKPCICMFLCVECGLKNWLMQLCGGKNVFLGTTESSALRVWALRWEWIISQFLLLSTILVYLILGLLFYSTALTHRHISNRNWRPTTSRIMTCLTFIHITHTTFPKLATEKTAKITNLHIIAKFLNAIWTTEWT